METSNYIATVTVIIAFANLLIILKNNMNLKKEKLTADIERNKAKFLINEELIGKNKILKIKNLGGKASNFEIKLDKQNFNKDFQDLTSQLPMPMNLYTNEEIQIRYLKTLGESGYIKLKLTWNDEQNKSYEEIRDVRI